MSASLIAMTDALMTLNGLRPSGELAGTQFGPALMVGHEHKSRFSIAPFRVLSGLAGRVDLVVLQDLEAALGALSRAGFVDAQFGVVLSRATLDQLSFSPGAKWSGAAKGGFSAIISELVPANATAAGQRIFVSAGSPWQSMRWLMGADASVVSDLSGMAPETRARVMLQVERGAGLLGVKATSLVEMRTAMRILLTFSSGRVETCELQL